MEILGRFGLLIAAGVILWLAKRLHGGSSKAQKNIAAALAFIGGLALLGTIVGGWMGTISSASPYVAGALFFLSVGGFAIDVWKDKRADKFAFYMAALMPLAIVFGLAQASNIADEIGKSGGEVSATVEKAGK